MPSLQLALVVQLLFPSPILGGLGYDAGAGVFAGLADTRNMECTRLSQAEAHALYPGQVPAPPARGSWPVADALACTSRFVRYGERSARDELILSSLRQSVGDIIHTAAALVPSDVTWHVDGFYPDAIVAAKIAVAAKTDLAERGHKVSDRVPLLAAGDIAVLGQMGPERAYAIACSRYFAQKVLTEKDVFLGLMIVDPREAQLHAGVCVQGGWRWLR